MYRKELADLLNISLSSLARKLAKKNVELPHGAIEPHDQKRVFQALWYPNIAWKQAFEALDDEEADEL
jgi:hypothetical protein